MAENNEAPDGFKQLLNAMMKRRWYITALVLGGFMFIIGGMFFAILNKSEIAGEWKELLLLLLGAFIGSYGKIIDYWFSDIDKDKMLVQKMDEEDGIAMSNTADMPVTPPNNTPLIPEAFQTAIENSKIEKVNDTFEQVPITEFKNIEESVVSLPKTTQPRTGIEIDEDGDGTMDGIDFDGDAYKNYCKWWNEVEADAKQHELYKDSVLLTKEQFIHNIKTDNEFAKKWGELGPIYGRMWRKFDEDGDGTMDGIDFDGDGKIDMYFAHRQCEHVWGDLDGDGEEECLKCGKIKDEDAG